MKRFALLALAPLFATVAEAQSALRQEKSLNAGLAAPVATPETPRLWDGKPQCTDEANSVACWFSFEHGGRGLFIHKNETTGNFLVCASTAGRLDIPIHKQAVVTTQCAVSSVPWDYYAHLSGYALNQRPDIKGVLRWNTWSSSRWGKMTIPAGIQDQCATSFPDALYCSPLMLILRNSNPAKLDVCQLRTKEDNVWALGFTFNSKTSSWTCRTEDMSVVGNNENITSSERYCLPWQVGTYNHECATPYIPRQEHPAQWGPRRF